MMMKLCSPLLWDIGLLGCRASGRRLHCTTLSFIFDRNITWSRQSYETNQSISSLQDSLPAISALIRCLTPRWESCQVKYTIEVTRTCTECSSLKKYMLCRLVENRHCIEGTSLC